MPVHYTFAASCVFKVESPIPHYKGGSVTIYAPGSGSVLRTISQGVKDPYALAFGP
ncbi:MAG: hypothetical protein WB615_06410 [Candidatus Tumulicola sp.]